MMLLGMNESQWLVVTVGHICMMELLMHAAPTPGWAFMGAAVWTGMRSIDYILRNIAKAHATPACSDTP